MATSARPRSVPTQMPPAEPGDLEKSVRESLQNLELRPEDAGVQELALRYARTIDAAYETEGRAVMSELGPKLLAALAELGATPKARAAAGEPRSQPSHSKLAALRGQGA